MMPHGGIMPAPSILSRLKQLIPGYAPRPTPPALVVETPDQRAARRLAEVQQQLDRSRGRPAPRVDEKVPANYYHGVAGKVWFLPYADSVTKDTPEIRAALRQMRKDGYVKAAWEPQIAAVASEDWQVQPAEPGNPEAEEQAEFVTRVFQDYLRGGMPSLVRAVCAPLGSDGFSVAEKVWAVGAKGRLEGKIVLEAAKPKDPEWLHVKGDTFNNVTHLTSTRKAGDEYPITDFLYSRYLTVFDEPLGEAAFRPAYGPYWQRDTVRKLRIIHCEKRMAGTLMGTYAADDDDQKSALEAALRQARSSTWISVPEGARVEALALSTASEPDYKSFDESLREEIVTSIAFATLQTMQGTVPDARGDSNVQKQTSDLGPWLLMTIVAQAVNEQLIPDLIDYNFPYPAAGGYPKLTFGAVSNAELLELVQIVEAAQRIGLKPSRKHYAGVLSIKEADPNDPDDQMQAAGQQSPMPPGGGFGGMGGDPFGGQQPDPFAFSEAWESFAWSPAKSRTGGVKAVGTAEDAGRSLYGRQAEAALARQGRTDRGEPHPEAPQEKAKRLAQEREPARAEARQAFAAVLADPASLTTQRVKELGARLTELNTTELRGLARNLSMAVGGLKPDLVRRLVSHVRGGEGEPVEDAPARGLPASPVVGKVYNAAPADLVVDPKRFQFKLNTGNAAGVTDELKAVGTWNPDFAGTLAVWKDPADGRTYVVNGHHRHDLATRLGATDLAVRYLDAKDAKTARAKGALINIAEGRGTAVDAAKFMRDMGVTKDDFAKYGVPLKDGGLADQATALTRLNDKAFDRLTRGELDMGKALGVARHVTDPARQEKLFGLLVKREDEGKDISNRTVEEMARAMAAAPTVTRTENTLWGVEETDEDVFVQRAELAGHVRAELAKEFGDFAALSSQRRAGVTAGAGNVLNIDENQKRAAAAEQAKNLYDQLVNRKGLIADALNDAAVKLANAKTKKERERVRAEATDAVRNAIRGEFAALDARAPANRVAEGGVVPRAGGSPVAPVSPAADGRGTGAGGGGLTADPFAAAGEDHEPAIKAIPPGGLAWVAGHAVRRTSDGRYQVETQKAYKTGTAAEINTVIRDTWRRAAAERAPAEKALARAAGFTEPDWFGGGSAAEEVVRRKAAVPAGARAVSLDPNTRGRVGNVVRDPDTGAARLQLDGQTEPATDFEPMESRFSWRVPEVIRPAVPKATTPDMFG